jgi:hypothetical protein
MSWSLIVDDPITLAQVLLRTLRGAADHVIALPKAVSALEHWQTARLCVIAVAEDRGPVVVPRVGIAKALDRGEAVTPERCAARR